MRPHNKKLPDNDILAREASRLSAQQLATRYGVNKGTVQSHLRMIGFRAPHRPVSEIVETDRSIIVEKRVTATEYGGTAILRISLPKVSMHLAFRANPKGSQ